MPKPNDRKAQKAKARQEAIRKQKAATTAQPRMLRLNPGLAEALSTRHRLIGYFVNEGWAKAGMASISVIREAESGEVFAGFLVDLMWRGTKDAFGNYGQTGVLAELQRRQRAHDSHLRLLRLDADVAVNMIRGGVEWARRWRYPVPADIDVWLRLVDPPPAAGLDLSIFGEGGERPVVIGTLEEVARYERFDPGVLLPDAERSDARDTLEIALRPGEDAGAGGLWLPSGDRGRLADAPPAPKPRRGSWRRLLPGGRRDEDD